ncbi:universal stress protein [Nonomuraea sp. NPDC050536]|uniref:universal stress protein n=1 Tax=Nonomuraea sp. NPDC050536 TaxID=3364366 RepID=UPI0037C84A78
MKLAKVLAGFITEPRGRDGLALAELLAKQAEAELTVATVQPPPWTTPGPGRTDESAWLAFLREEAEATLDQARAVVGSDASFVAHFQKGSGRGLGELARKQEADVVVIGSAPRGARGRISLGSTADQLLHSSPVPVALAPKGYGEAPPTAIERLTFAYRRGTSCDTGLTAAAQLAAALDVPLRLVTLVVSGGRRAKIHEEMLLRLREQAAADLKMAARGQRRVQVDVEVLDGRNVVGAMAATSWLPGELIVCASSDAGPLRRVFLGDISIKIVRAAPVPVMILTREPVTKR